MVLLANVRLIDRCDSLAYELQSEKITVPFPLAKKTFPKNGTPYLLSKKMGRMAARNK